MTRFGTLVQEFGIITEHCCCTAMSAKETTTSVATAHGDDEFCGHPVDVMISQACAGNEPGDDNEKGKSVL